MKPIRVFLWLFLFLLGKESMAHQTHYDPSLLHTWFAHQPGKELKASFFMKKGNLVYLEKADGSLVAYPIPEFSPEDQTFISQKTEWLSRLHKAHESKNAGSFPIASSQIPVWVLFLFCLLMSVAIVQRSRLAFGMVISALVTGGMMAFRTKGSMAIQTDLDPTFVDSTFIPFKPAVYTHWDNQWFYVESKGLPNHEMMTGITKWQQQTPIPQCYTGSNAWQIPLHPVPAATPVPVNQEHFLRGAIAIAANGIPIFNPYTNTGVDALLDGQLDQWGGHSGRADDYHYHIAPLHLYVQSHHSKPIAYGLDGFPVYGSLEPDGSPMAALDENHGHMGTNGVYHYHGTSTAPYMIGRMVGQVTEDATLQIVPQAAAHPVRPSGTPLNGASITAFTSNPNGNGFTLFYTRNNENYSWSYSWNANNVFTFNYVTPSGTTTNTYNGQAPCSLPVGTTALETSDFQTAFDQEEKVLRVYSKAKTNLVGILKIVSMDGKVQLETPAREQIFLRSLSSGVYQIMYAHPNGEQKVCGKFRVY